MESHNEILACLDCEIGWQRKKHTRKSFKTFLDGHRGHRLGLWDMNDNLRGGTLNVSMVLGSFDEKGMFKVKVG